MNGVDGKLGRCTCRNKWRKPKLFSTGEIGDIVDTVDSGEVEKTSKDDDGRANSRNLGTRSFCGKLDGEKYYVMTGGGPEHPMDTKNISLADPPVDQNVLGDPSGWFRDNSEVVCPLLPPLQLEHNQNSPEHCQLQNEEDW